ncbi:integrase, catalytic region, zinc finger, CCHC-type containing protein [Tanacetum coccineum]
MKCSCLQDPCLGSRIRDGVGIIDMMMGFRNGNWLDLLLIVYCDDRIELRAISSVRRQSNRDSSFKKSVLSNTKNSSEKVEVSARSNKTSDVASMDVDSNKKIVTNDDIKNALIAKNVLCVTCAKNVLIPCHDDCLAKYKLNVHSKVKRALFTTSRTVKSKFEGTTLVLSKTRFSVKTIQSKSLDTTLVVSKTKIAAVTPLSAKHKVVQIVMWIVDSGCSKHMTGDRSLLNNFVEKFMGTVRFGNDHFAAITGYGDYIQGNITIFHVYYVEGLGQNLFSFGQFYDDDLEVAFRSKTCYVSSINGKRYILVIVDDYSRFTWVYFLRIKDETLEIIKSFIARVQLNYNAKVCKIRTDNGTEFMNAALKAHYDKLGIMQQFLIARTPQQNGVVERRNRTLVKAARTMLIFSRLPEFLWAEAVSTACFTQN